MSSVLTFPFELDRSTLWKWITGIIVVVFVPRLWNSYRRWQSMPPGPPGVPILGNIFQVPVKMPWFKFAEWAREYGPIYSLNMAGQPIVVLSTFKTTADLLDRRSNLYSDRPRLIMASEILTGGIFMVFARYGTVWRKMRRAGHEGFNFRAAEKYKPVQAREAAFGALRILDTPDAWDTHLKRATAGSILSAVYGWKPISSKDEPLIKRIHAHTARIAAAVVPGAFLVDIIPILKYAPTWMAKWKREGLEWHQQETDMFEGFNKDVEVNKKNGTLANHCFVGELIDTRDRHELTDKEAAWLAGIMFSAGAETTSGTLLYFIQAMVLYPEIQKKAQEELDRVVGRDRIPTFEDFDDLPYIRAMVKECLRWRPVGPLAVPRTISEDDWYEGYLIPKGTTVIPNIWAMNRDPQIFPDFDEFRPDRFLDGTPDDTHSMGHTTFGFGRRICVGFNFANQSLFITFATILWALNIETSNDANGKPIIPDKNDFLDAGVVVGPMPFKCKITPRFPEARQVLEREMPEEMRT
ncbi:cytochrome P450 [Agrocybe pediades]|nr:cytochrome P450 [Agrocybe pediades]